MTDTVKYRDAWDAVIYKPRERDIKRWGVKHFRTRGSAFGSRLNLTSHPWLKDVFDAYADPNVRRITIMSSAQCGKTTALLTVMAYRMCENPANMLCAFNTDAQSIAFSRTNFWPTLDACEPVKDLMPDRSSGRKLRQSGDRLNRSVIFKDGTFLLIGPSNESFLRSHSIKLAMGDEVSDWNAGAIANLEARTTTFADRKIFLCSTPLNYGEGKKGDEFERHWRQGTQEIWSLGCLNCGEKIPLKFRDIIKWDHDKAMLGDFEYDFGVVKRTTRLVCPNCKYKHTNTPTNIRSMNALGGYIKCNEEADGTHRSFRFNKIALPPTLCKWSDLAVIFIKANRELDLYGNEQPMADFINLSLGESWSVEKMQTHRQLVSDDEIGLPKDESYCRVAGIDVQQDHYWILIRDYAQNGDSVLKAFRKCSNETEIKQVLKEFKVGNPDNPRDVVNKAVAIDCAFEPDRVYKMCHANGWIAIRGDNSSIVWKRYDHVKRWRDGKKERHSIVKRPWNILQKVALGGSRKHAKLLVVNTNELGRLVCQLRDRTVRPVSPRWESPRKALGDYIEDWNKQVRAKVLKRDIDSRGQKITLVKEIRADDHAFDCELYALTLAVRSGVKIGRKENVETVEGNIQER